MSDYIDTDSTNDDDYKNYEPKNDSHTDPLSNADRMRLLTARRRRVEDIQEERKLRDELGLYDEAFNTTKIAV
ncbi:hypothetical protein [Dasania marina]|uniref:hypothetical protein n=1 Tax=Dasania marina TaxID=471499 RepID=UPI0030D843AC|tara:strand:- start:67041 stop:67259 length:219 start_codon:yes stop_codon:yes gene_type:complete